MSHEALIDSAWDAAIKPLLLKRFPDATPDQLERSAFLCLGRSHHLRT